MMSISAGFIDNSAIATPADAFPSPVIYKSMFKALALSYLGIFFVSLKSLTVTASKSGSLYIETNSGF